MQTIFIILTSIILLGIFTVVGFSSATQKTPTPSVKPKALITPASPGSGGKQLQINSLKLTSPQPSSLIHPSTSSQPSDECDSDSNRANKPGCQCPGNEILGVFCNNGQTVPTYNYTSGLGNAYITIKCQGGGIPCALFGKIGYGDIQASWACQPDSCIYLKDPSTANSIPWPIPSPNFQTYENQCGSNSICFGKPVIYLYPDRITQVAVKLDIPGKVTESIPHYPEGGWQNITAYPGGLFNYQGQVYNELYYESSVTKNFIPKEGFVLPMDSLPVEIDSILNKMGLLPKEREEFLAYWLPKLNALNQPYIFMGFLNPGQKEAVDKVSVSPKPDTTITFLAYFKGLTMPSFYPRPKLPAVPERKGFTMVEWGGTIDQ